ncbi:MAG: hypothetical protein KGO96_10820 [Elusimicrobia bacterium]|nr:hypothetical protein [Elusimicrobiota bacterium]MDE2237318.1 hypothetical protein [Elusimicrobiota bacterium]MDE2426385.1 hypothetical protein [Elusimicrobiota bacterium]
MPTLILIASLLPQKAPVAAARTSVSACQWPNVCSAEKAPVTTCQWPNVCRSQA